MVRILINEVLKEAPNLRRRTTKRASQIIGGITTELMPKEIIGIPKERLKDRNNCSSSPLAL